MISSNSNINSTNTALTMLAYILNEIRYRTALVTILIVNFFLLANFCLYYFIWKVFAEKINVN